LSSGNLQCGIARNAPHQPKRGESSLHQIFTTNCPIGVPLTGFNELPKQLLV
jgi:hypothetical protein